MRKLLPIPFFFIFNGLIFAQSASGLSDARFAHLRHGINLSHWYAQVFDPRGYTKAHLDDYNTEYDLALIRRMGFDHVRLTLDPSPLFDKSDPQTLNRQWLAYLDETVKMIRAHDLAVIIDIHPAGEFNRRLNKEDSHVLAFADFWRSLAKHFSGNDPEHLFLEILNEPEVEDAYRWMGIQQKLARAIREGAPEHTIILSGARWSSLSDLLSIQPLVDNNVIYNFHYYEPMIFTHQGATWAGEMLRYLRKSPYPSSAENVQALLALVPYANQRLQIVRYGYDRWDRDRIAADFAQAAAWAKSNGVRVTCNEFGVYRKFADPRQRAAYLHDLRTAAEKYGFGWTMWDYAGGFSVVNRSEGQRATPDSVTLEALGLDASAK